MRMTLRKILLWLLDKSQRGSKVPFGGYFTTGIAADGQAPIQFVWNRAFIENIRAAGYSCETEEEMVELFYVAVRPTPQYDVEEEPVNSEEHPMLSNDGNYFRQ